MRQIGIRTRLTLVYSFVLACILVSVTAVSYRFLKFRLDENLRQELRERSAGLRGYLRFEDGKPEFKYDPDDPDEAFFVESSTRYYQIFDLASGDLLDQSHELDLLKIDERPRFQPFSEAESGNVRLIFCSEIIRTSGGRSYLLQLGIRRDPADAALNQFLLIAVFLVPAGLGIAAVASWWMAGRALRPINGLTRAAEEIGISDLDRRLPLSGTGDEIDRLSATFNDMFARLARAIGEMKQFTASISHELRTPLTALRGEAEVLLLQPHPVQEYRRVLASHLEEYDRLGRLISKLLTLARAESGDIRMHLGTVDLSSLVRYLVEQLEIVAASKHIEISFCSEGPVRVIADHEWLESAILNLLDNAIKYTPDGGKVSVTVESHGAEQKLIIQDTGIGIAADALPHVFERFFRADPSRSLRYEGAGLGLNLVQWIVKPRFRS